MNRREFLKGASLVGTAAVLGDGCATLPSVGGDTVTFCAFADIHYGQSGFWPHANREWLERILNRAVERKADFVVSLGDMSFEPVKDRAYEEYYRDFKPVKTYQVLGNHEFEHATYEEIAPVDENFGENTISMVFQKGFKLGDKVVRFAMVQVAN